jgi:hypothetical protein
MKHLRLILLVCLAAGVSGCNLPSTSSAKTDKGTSSSAPSAKKDLPASTATGFTHELREDQPYFAQYGSTKPPDGTLKAKSRVRLVEKKDDVARVAIEGEMELDNLTPLEGGGPFTHKAKEGASYYTSIVQGRPPDGAFKTPANVTVTKSKGNVAQIALEVEIGAAALVPLDTK